MYILLEVTPGPVSDQTNSSIKINAIKHINGRVSALTMLEEVSREFIKEEVGKSGDKAEIATINDLKLIKTPDNDGIYMFKLEDDPDKIFLYQKLTNVIPSNSWIFNNTVESNFKQLKYYQIVAYEGASDFANRNEKVEMVTRSKSMHVPKALTIAPFTSMIKQMIDSDIFRDHSKLKKVATQDFINKMHEQGCHLSQSI